MSLDGVGVPAVGLLEGAKFVPAAAQAGMDHTDSSRIPAVDALALSMMNSFGQLSLILAHMHRYQAEGKSAPDAAPPPFVLHDLLEDVLTGLADSHTTEDIATAAQMLASATELIGDELFVVDVDRLGEG